MPIYGPDERPESRLGFATSLAHMEYVDSVEDLEDEGAGLRSNFERLINVARQEQPRIPNMNDEVAMEIYRKVEDASTELIKIFQAEFRNHESDSPSPAPVADYSCTFWSYIKELSILAGHASQTRGSGRHSARPKMFEVFQKLTQGRLLREAQNEIEDLEMFLKLKRQKALFNAEESSNAAASEESPTQSAGGNSRTAGVVVQDRDIEREDSEYHDERKRDLSNQFVGLSEDTHSAEASVEGPPPLQRLRPESRDVTHHATSKEVVETAQQRKMRKRRELEVLEQKIERRRSSDREVAGRDAQKPNHNRQKGGSSSLTVEIGLRNVRIEVEVDNSSTHDYSSSSGPRTREGSPSSVADTESRRTDNTRRALPVPQGGTGKRAAR